MAGWNEGPRGFPPQNQLVVAEPDVVGWIGLPMIKLEEFQWACEFENQENENSSEGQSGAFLLSNEYHIWDAEHSDLGCTSSSAPEVTECQAYPSTQVHYRVAKATPFLPHSHFVQVSSFVPLANSCSAKKSFLVLSIRHKHGHGSPSCKWNML